MDEEPHAAAAAAGGVVGDNIADVLKRRSASSIAPSLHTERPLRRHQQPAVVSLASRDVPPVSGDSPVSGSVRRWRVTIAHR